MSSRRLASWLLALLACAPLAVLPPSAYAQRNFDRPEIDDFYVESDGGFAAGAELTITLEGTPRGQASAQIRGVGRPIPLTEVQRGVYTGRYTISRGDRISANSSARATLRVRGEETAAVLDALAQRGPPRGEPPAAPLAQGPSIERFSVAPIDRIEPGAELKFTLLGTPRGSASFTIEGVATNLPMREVRSGVYEGDYTIRRQDKFPAAVSVVATLEASGRSVPVRLNQSLLADAKAPVVTNISPRDRETVAPGVHTISAIFDDGGGVGVDPKGVRVVIGGKDVTASAAITPQSFSYRAELPPGTYPVEVTARDMAGNAVRHAWAFTVAPQAEAASLPLQILSHADNAQIGGGTTEVRGRTAPDARVDVQVQAVSSLGGLFPVTRSVLNESLRADPAGNFAFSFRPQLPIPGTRFEIAVNATKGELAKDLKLVLIQQR